MKTKVLFIIAFFATVPSLVSCKENHSVEEYLSITTRIKKLFHEKYGAQHPLAPYIKATTLLIETYARQCSKTNRSDNEQKNLLELRGILDDIADAGNNLISYFSSASEGQSMQDIPSQAWENGQQYFQDAFSQIPGVGSQLMQSAQQGYAHIQHEMNKESFTDALKRMLSISGIGVACIGIATWFLYYLITPDLRKREAERKRLKKHATDTATNATNLTDRLFDADLLGNRQPGNQSR